MFLAQSMAFNLARLAAIARTGSSLLFLTGAAITCRRTVELNVQPAWAVLPSTTVVHSRYLRLKSVLDRIAAAIPGTFGLRSKLER